MESAPVTEATETTEGSVIAVTAKKDGKEATVNFDFGTDLETAVDMFGDAVVFSRFRAASKIDLQSVMRRYLDAGKDCQELLTLWKPGVTLERIVDPKAAAKNAFAKMDAAEKEAFLAELRAEL